MSPSIDNENGLRLVPGDLLSPLVAGAADEGVKQIQQLIKRATSGVESITEAKLQVQKTMNAYNRVLAPPPT